MRRAASLVLAPAVQSTLTQIPTRPSLIPLIPALQDDSRVGKRKRSMRWDQMERTRGRSSSRSLSSGSQSDSETGAVAYSGGSGYSVPPEFALVPVRAYMKEEEQL